MKTILYDNHKQLNAKFVSFASWEMPLYYQGIHKEVKAVRSTLGLFDVSHMGRISITGPDTVSFLEFLSTNTVYDKSFGKAFYTIFCNAEGYAMDDLLAYLIEPKKAFLVVNASNRAKVLGHLKNVSSQFAVSIEDHYQSGGILSLQGPQSGLILQDLVHLEPFQFVTLKDGLIVSRTGYTGEEGYEFYGASDGIKKLWAQLLERGERFGIEPCGLAARDILRLEKGYALYGHELSESIYPLESVSKWAVKMDAHDFLGKTALQKVKKNHELRYPIALAGHEPIPAREGYSIFYQGREIGTITSGTFSPTTQQPIALGMVDAFLPENIQVEVLIRSAYHFFKIVKLPFTKRS